MPTSARLTLAQLRDQIKVEARVKGADNLDGFINNLVNELLVSYADKNRYFELLVTNHAIATLAATGVYALPDDFLRPRLVRLKSSTGHIRTLNLRSDYVETATGSRPRYYEATGGQISVYPFDELLADETILMDYYKIPDTLADADPFPIPRLLPTIKLDAVHRVMIFNNQMAQAAALKGEAADIETRARPSG